VALLQWRCGGGTRGVDCQIRQLVLSAICHSLASELLLSVIRQLRYVNSNPRCARLQLPQRETQAEADAVGAEHTKSCDKYLVEVNVRLRRKRSAVKEARAGRWALKSALAASSPTRAKSGRASEGRKPPFFSMHGEELFSRACVCLLFVIVVAYVRVAKFWHAC